MKPDLVNHAFHGKIEPVRNHDVTLPTIALEGIELSVFVVVIYFIFARFWINKFPAQRKETAQTGGSILGASAQMRK